MEPVDDGCPIVITTTLEPMKTNCEALPRGQLDVKTDNEDDDTVNVHEKRDDSGRH